MRKAITTFALSGLLAAAAAYAAEQAPRAVIEDTYIVAPRTVGAYTLIHSENYGDQGKPYDGVSLQYRDALLPSMTANVFVYPSGPSQTPAAAEEEFRTGMHWAVKQGTYGDVTWAEAQDYDLQRRDGSHWQGRMLSMRISREKGELASRTYLFVHDLFGYKFRISIPADQAAELPAAADTLVRAVLREMLVVSTGSCGKQMTVNVLKDGDTVPEHYVDGVSPDGFGIAFHTSDLGEAPADSSSSPLDSPLVALTLLAMQRQIAYGCTTAPFKPTDDNRTVLKLRYPAGFWNSPSE